MKNQDSKKVKEEFLKVKDKSFSESASVKPMQGVSKIKIGKKVYQMEGDLGGWTLRTGIVLEYDELTDMYYVNGDFEDWCTRSSLHTNKQKCLKNAS